MAKKPPNRALSTPHPRTWEPPEVERLGQLLPQYEVIKIIGRGGMGAVYKARQKSLQRPVAIKILPPQAADDELKFAGRFRHEAQTLAQLGHPAIVGVYDFGETPEGQLYFVMEFVDGTDVAALLRANGAMPAERALGIIRAVCDALHCAHGHGVIHRDIKPANVLIGTDGQIKVADFGLAKCSAALQQTVLTRTDVVIGTQEFAAPEMLTPGSAVDHRADIYSAGVMLYQMLTGEVPRVMFKLPSRLRPGLDPRLDAIICKALETDPAERFQSAIEMRDALAGIFDLPTQPPRSGGAKVIAPRRSRAWLMIAAVAALALVLGGWIVWRNKSHAASAPRASGIQPGGVINLLALVDVKRDAIAGDWSLTDAGLAVQQAGEIDGGSARLQLPYQPPEEYDFEIEFTPGDGIGYIMQGLSDGRHGFHWSVDWSLVAGKKAGFSIVDGISMLENKEASIMRPHLLVAGKRHVSRAEVRKKELRGYLDGELLVDWKGDLNRLSMGTKSAMRDQLHLGLVVPDRAVTFHRITVREIKNQ